MLAAWTVTQDSSAMESLSLAYIPEYLSDFLLSRNYEGLAYLVLAVFTSQLPPCPACAEFGQHAVRAVFGPVLALLHLKQRHIEVIQCPPSSLIRDAVTRSLSKRS